MKTLNIKVLVSASLVSHSNGFVSPGIFHALSPTITSTSSTSYITESLSSYQQYQLRNDSIRASRRREKLYLFVGGGFGELLYNVQTSTSDLAITNLSSDFNFLVSIPILYLAGLLTSFSPCALSILPLTVSYISSATGEREDQTSLAPSLAYAAGLASVFVTLGLSVSLLGAGVYGQVGKGNIVSELLTAVLSNGVAIAMGLQLLNLINLPLPSLETELSFLDDSNSANNEDTKSPSSSVLMAYDNTPTENELLDGNDKSAAAAVDDDSSITTTKTTAKSQRRKNQVGLVKTFLLGGSSALIASPCSTPVLTSLLAFVASNANPLIGIALLLTYTAGYSTPLVIVGATGGQALAQIASADGTMGKVGRVVTPVTAAILIWYGTTGFLTALFGDPSVAGLEASMMR